MPTNLNTKKRCDYQNCSVLKLMQKLNEGTINKDCVFYGCSKQGKDFCNMVNMPKTELQEINRLIWNAEYIISNAIN